MTQPDGQRTYPPPEQLELLAAELEGRAEAQSAEVEGLDRKASTALAATGVVLGLVLNSVSQFRDAAWQPRSLFLGALVALAAGLVSGVGAIWPRRVKIVSAPRRLIEGYYAKSRANTQEGHVAPRLRRLQGDRRGARGGGGGARLERWESDLPVG